MRTPIVVLAAVLSLVCLADGQKHQAQAEDLYVPPSSPLVREKLEWFQDQKLCLMLHFGLYSLLGITESWPLSSEDAFWARADIARSQQDDAAFKRRYFALNRAFNPVRFDAEEWVRAAKRGGFRYLAFVTKHHDGFCLFDSRYSDYKTTDSSCPFSTSPDADIVRRLFDACRAGGLGISACFSKPDWHHEDFWENRGIGRFTNRKPTYDIGAKPEKWARFREFTRNQILELVREYGPFDTLWLDGGWVTKPFGYDISMSEIVAEARKTKPDLIVVDRCAMDENVNIRTPEQIVPEKPLPYPWETCMTMGSGWGYHFDDTYKSPRELIHLLVDVVAKGGNLALDVGPMPDGRLPRPAVERMEAMGDWLKTNGEAIYATRAVAPYSHWKWRFTKGKDGRVFAIRLWEAGEERRASVILNVAPEQGEVRRIVHLATGREMTFVPVSGPYECGVRIDLPADFAQNPYADAFVVDYLQSQNKEKTK